jgi:hypothetical protein
MFKMFVVSTIFVFFGSSASHADEIKFIMRTNKIEVADGSMIELTVTANDVAIFTDLNPGAPWPHSVTYSVENKKTRVESESVTANQPPKSFANSRYPVACSRERGMPHGYEAYEINDFVDQDKNLLISGPPWKIRLNHVYPASKIYFVDLNPLANWSHDAMILIRAPIPPGSERVAEKILVWWRPKIVTGTYSLLNGSIISCDHNAAWGYDNLELPNKIARP